MLTVACVWVQGNVSYSVDYVARLRAMVARKLDRPFRFVCLTDQPSKVPAGVEAVPVPGPGSLCGWWSKVRLFDQALGLSGRVLYLDLDTLVMAPLGPIVDYPAPFALIPDAGNFVPRNRFIQCVKRFNSSVMVWDAGCNRALFDDWNEDVANRLHGDQDWIGEHMPKAAMMPLAWFPRLSEVTDPPFDKDVKVILAKVPKNHIAVKTRPWVREVWQ